MVDNLGISEISLGIVPDKAVPDSPLPQRGITTSPGQLRSRYSKHRTGVETHNHDNLESLQISLGIVPDKAVSYNRLPFFPRQHQGVSTWAGDAHPKVYEAYNNAHG
jgi:hypothetical protein